MAKIYTRTGDAGETSLLGGRRVRKDDVRIEALGAVDELNAALGVALAEFKKFPSRVPQQPAAAIYDLVGDIQHRLFDLGAELAGPASRTTNIGLLNDADVTTLEKEIDQYQAGLDELQTFILPGGVSAAAQFHLARCVCRRAERRLVTLSGFEPIRNEVLRYVNRLSDLLFVLARAINQTYQVPDVMWKQRSGVTHHKSES